MAGQQIEVAASRFEKGDRGMLALSLTNYDNDSEPQIAAGSIVEIGDAIFQFTAAESITGWGSIGNNNDVYIKLVVAGTAVTAEFTTAAPTWDLAKQGWYGTGGAALHRHVAKLYKDGAGAYTLKRMLTRRREYIETADIAALAVTNEKVAADAITDAQIDKTLGAWQSQVIGAGAGWVVPAGIYIFASNEHIGVQVQGAAPGEWYGTAANLGGAIISDGTNVRLLADGTGATVNYRQLA